MINVIITIIKNLDCELLREDSELSQKWLPIFTRLLLPSSSKYVWVIQGVFKMLEQTSGIISSHQGRKYIHINISQEAVFDVQLPRSPDTRLLDFHLCGYLKPLLYSAPISNEKTLHQRIF